MEKMAVQSFILNLNAIKGKQKMAIKFNRDAYTRVFDDLDKYLDFCRFELREFNPSHLYNKSNENWRAYLASKRSNYRPRKPRFNNKRNYN